MSIIYKGLNPKHHYGLCILTINGELITANGKHFQAIQIPTPNGRLIDGDNILIAMGDRKKSLIEAFNLHHIIEAEE